jgi:hypothetical protein
MGIYLQHSHEPLRPIVPTRKRLPFLCKFEGGTVEESENGTGRLGIDLPWFQRLFAPLEPE